MRYRHHLDARLPAAGVLVALGLVAGVVCGAARGEERREAYVVKIDGGISEAYTEAIERKLRYAEQQGVRTVILELRTPGGYLQDSMDLADYIFQLKDMDVIAAHAGYITLTPLHTDMTAHRVLASPKLRRLATGFASLAR